jgi:hypothetical protein
MPTLEDYRVISGAYAVASYKRVFLSSVRAKPTVRDLQLLSAVGNEHSSRLRAKTCSLSISDVSVPMPDQDARQYAADLMSRSVQTSVAAALVLEGEGFLAGTARAVGTAIGLLARSPVPWKTFAAVGQASEWLTSLLGYDATDSRALAEVALELRRRHRTER